jgi:hypothetical protein
MFLCCYAIFFYRNGYRNVIGLVEVKHAYNTVETLFNRQRVVFIGGTLRQKRNGQLTMSRKKPCRKLRSSLV